MSDARHGRWRLRPARLPEDADAWGQLRLALWPDEPECATAADLQAALHPQSDSLVLLAVDEDDIPIGFAEAKLRRDYVNGTRSTPVGFLEGWFVAPAHRGQGLGRALTEAVAAWTREQGCSELASDAWLHDTASHAAHAACGFAETERVVYFRRTLLP